MVCPRHVLVITHIVPVLVMDIVLVLVTTATHRVVVLVTLVIMTRIIHRLVLVILVTQRQTIQ